MPSVTAKTRAKNRCHGRTVRYRTNSINTVLNGTGMGCGPVFMGEELTGTVQSCEDLGADQP